MITFWPFQEVAAVHVFIASLLPLDDNAIISWGNQSTTFSTPTCSSSLVSRPFPHCNQKGCQSRQSWNAPRMRPLQGSPAPCVAAAPDPTPATINTGHSLKTPNFPHKLFLPSDPDSAYQADSTPLQQAWRILWEAHCTYISYNVTKKRWEMFVVALFQMLQNCQQSKCPPTLDGTNEYLCEKIPTILHCIENELWMKTHQGCICDSTETKLEIEQN